MKPSLFSNELLLGFQKKGMLFAITLTWPKKQCLLKKH